MPVKPSITPGRFAIMLTVLVVGVLVALAWPKYRALTRVRA